MSAGADPGQDVQVDPAGVKVVLEDQRQATANKQQYQRRDPQQSVDRRGFAAVSPAQRDARTGL